MQPSLSAALLIVILAIVILGLTPFGWAQGGESPIYNFGNDASHGINPVSKLVVDQQGNLYGTTSFVGFTFSNLCTNPNGCGTVFEIIPLGAGTWALGNYYVFSGGADGAYPWGGLVLDGAGNIYGTTASGGDPSCYCGTVFELTPKNGGWTFHTLHTFDGSKSDYWPQGRLVMDKSGNIYGTTIYSVFELTPTKKGWKYKVIHNNWGSRGAGLSAGLLIGQDGTLYSTSNRGGKGVCNFGGANQGCGFVFQLKPGTKSGWKYSVLYNFLGPPNDGYSPQGELTADAAGNLYSTTTGGGNGSCTQQGYPGGCGTLFELSPSGGKWREQILHNFVGGATDGALPFSGPVLDSNGELLGTAWSGGSSGSGIIYKWSPGPPSWTISSFLGGNDGAFPTAPLSFDSFGVLYGATAYGGVYGEGTLFTLLP